MAHCIHAVMKNLSKFFCLFLHGLQASLTDQAACKAILQNLAPCTQYTHVGVSQVSFLGAACVHLTGLLQTVFANISCT